MARYANVIVDISVDKLDKTFQYAIPQELQSQIVVGVQVDIPFGYRTMSGYVVELTDTPELEESKIKNLIGVRKGSIAIESQLIALAGWIRKNYGSTMNQALKTVLPIKQKKKAVIHRRILLALSEGEAAKQLALFEAKHQTARARLLRALMKQNELDYGIATGELRISAATLRSLVETQMITIQTEETYRNPVEHLAKTYKPLSLNPDQQAVVDRVMKHISEGIAKTYLLKGVTGSGKTEVYMELIAGILARNQQAIVLIPEIALTYQTVMRFYGRFGNRVSIMNSKLSAGERYDQFLRAKQGDIDIMIGPRSALFTPFSNLGLIIIDEEHETSYKSESVPRYHAREVAIERARMNGASVVLGSATPSVYSYYQSECGNYERLELNRRVQEKPLPDCEIIDLREELKRGNRSILSGRLQTLMEDRLQKGQQTMLFINRRGLSGFISCRACGNVIKCPHCDVSLSQHNNGKMVCHYCGHEEPVPKVCPACGSKYIGGFKAGTQRVEEIVQKRFPTARILRMDFDTTRTKDAFEKILTSFANQEADILIGTQMIVKGHDFPNVTLVGVLAADMSLHVNDFHASERTFQLLTQAAGRAGRGSEPGYVVIQTYAPEHYAITAAKKQDYTEFYQKEIAYRQMMFYPPVWNLLVIWCTSAQEEEANQAGEQIARMLNDAKGKRGIQVVGPADATISKVNDTYRKVVYVKAMEYETLVELKDHLEIFMTKSQRFANVVVQFDFNPMNGF